MTDIKEIPKVDGFYWVRLHASWPPQIIEYVKGVVYITGSRERYSPDYDVYSWYNKVEYLGD